MTRGTWTSEDQLQDRFRVYWGTVTGNGAEANACHLNTSNEWAFWSSVYTKYKVTGVKMSWAPDLIVGGGTQISWKELHVASYENAAITQNATTILQLQQKPDYQSVQLGKPYSKYVSVAKYQKRLNGFMCPNIDSDFSAASTQFLGRDAGLTMNSVVGYFNVKYYVTFYGPRGAI